MSRPTTPIPTGCSFSLISCQIDISYNNNKNPQKQIKKEDKINDNNKKQCKKICQRISLKNKNNFNNIKIISQDIHQCQNLLVCQYQNMEKQVLRRQIKEKLIYQQNLQKNHYFNRKINQKINIQNSEIIWQLSHNHENNYQNHRGEKIIQSNNSPTLLSKLKNHNVFIDEFTLNNHNNEQFLKEQDKPVVQRNIHRNNHHHNNNENANRQFRRSMTEENEKKGKSHTVENCSRNFKQVPLVFRSELLNSTKNKEQPPVHSCASALSPKHTSYKKPQIKFQKYNQNGQLAQVCQNIPLTLQKTKNSKLLQLSTQVQQTGTKSQIQVAQTQNIKQPIIINHIRKLSVPQFIKISNNLNNFNNGIFQNIQYDSGNSSTNYQSIIRGCDDSSFQVSTGKGYSGIKKKGLKGYGNT